MRRRVFFAVFSFSMALPRGEALDIPQGLPSSTKGSPFGRAGAKRLRGQARHERTAHAAISRLFVSAMLSLRPQITVSILALSVTFGDSSPKGGASGVPVRPTRDEQSLIFSGTVVLRCLGQQQLDKVRLSRSRCPRKQGPPFCAISGLRRPDES